MARRKWTIEKKNYAKKLKIKQHEPLLNPRVNSCAPEV
jgi:hypothetical protein